MRQRGRGTADVMTIVLLALFTPAGPLCGQPRDSTMNPVTIGGYVDSYFSFNLDRPITHVNELRNFDVTENQIVLSTAEITVQKTASPIGFRVDLDFGPANDIVQSGAAGSVSDFRQAFVTVVAPVGSGLTLDAGKFVTHCCYEVIPAKDNFNYSRSFLFAWSVPYYHFGVRGSYPFSGDLTLNAYLYNGWNGAPANSGKTFGVEAAYAPTAALSIVGNWLGGPALPDSVSREFRNIYELIVSYQTPEKLTFALNAVYGRDVPAGVTTVWKGVAMYARYAFTELSALSARSEVFSDPRGFMTGTPQILHEATLTYEHRFFPSLILRGEYRYDWSTAAPFDGDTGPHARRNQATVATGAIVVF